MFRAIIILSILTVAFGSLELFTQCTDTYKETIQRDYLLGDWYLVYEFTLFGTTLPSINCPNSTFTIPTAEEIKAYKDKYDSAGFPFTIDDNSVLYEENKNSQYTSAKVGLYAGDAEAKYFVLDPKSPGLLNMYGYEVEIYNRVNDNFMFYQRCAMRGHHRMLFSRNKDAPHEEMLAIINSHPEVKRMNARRYCTPRL
ncbi:uncharacterized protein LOC142980761 [Anticarsia gemmatalis]|uniref:uncharacterized protein LOC142980761 n=1 Tax=Anticarsia gemmatalis TaxID=129554 RepID=UPI003F776342